MSRAMKLPEARSWPSSGLSRARYGPPLDPGKFLAACVAAQCGRMVGELLARSAILEHHVKERGVRVLSATYDLRTGKVDHLSQWPRG